MKNFKGFFEQITPGSIREPGREPIGGRFQSASPKKPTKSVPQVTSEEIKSFSDFLGERCWPGHKPVPGKKPYSPGSCVKEEEDMEEDWSQKYKNSIDCNNPKGFSQKAHCDGKKKNESVNEDLRNWFDPNHPKGGWKRVNSKGEVVGDCAREPGEPKPKCMSNAQRASLSKKEKASAVRRKRKEDPNPERQGEPINVKSKVNENMEQLDEKNKPTNPELWSRAIAQAKSKFDVYPSAYANGWAAKWYKEKGGGWKSVAEAMEVGDDPVNQGTPEGLTKRGPKTVLKKFKELSMEGAVPSTEKTVTVKHKTSGKELVVTAQKAKEYQQQGYHPVKQISEIVEPQVKGDLGTLDKNSFVKKHGITKTAAKQRLATEAKEKTEYDYEGDMARGQLQSIINNAERVHDMLEDNDNLPEWVQSKITLAEDYISTVANYMMSEIDEEVEQLEEGRPSQRHPLEGHEYHKKSDEALVHIAKDAHAAAEAMKGHNTDAENKYRDQANDSATVRHFRKTSGKPDWYKKKYGLKESFRPMDEPNYNNSIQARQKKADDANKPPFDGPYKKTPTVVTDKSGAKHGPMSRARDLARNAAKKQAGKMHEEKQKSRKAQIIKDASRGKDKFEKDPIITDTTVKSDNLQ